MHYIQGHYVLSARKHHEVIIFDSLPSQKHLEEVVPQLTILHEDLDIDSTQKTPGTRWKTFPHSWKHGACSIKIQSPVYVHMLIWCKETPVYGESLPEHATDFIDSYITCHDLQKTLS